MATEETKPDTKETKPEENQSPEIKNPPPLPYNTCSFKVSIHCEGCKKKVKKILTTIEGVYKVDIDVKQHKVTVVGIVPPEILLKKLLKAGKQAVLIPEIPVLEKKKSTENKNKKKEEKKESSDGATSSGSCKQPESVKADVGDGESGSCDGGDEVVKATDSGECSEPVKEEKKVDLKEKGSVPADSPAPSAEKSAGVEKKAEESGGNICKKKKKKGQKSSIAHNTTGAPARPESPPQPTFPTVDQDRPLHQSDWHPTVTNHIPPGHAMYPYPANYYAPPILYGVSYNVAQPPVSLHGPSYYTPPPPHSYAHMHPGYLPSDRNPYPSGPSDSFEFFSDENPNACSVM